MNKENVLEQTISAEQKARISSNFRAAKALLARKRSIGSPPISTHHNLIDGHESKRKFPRLPLSELPVASPSTIPLKGVVTASSNYSPSGSGMISEIPTEHDGFMSTLKTQQECCGLNDKYHLVDDLDDDIDETILKQIDALCEQRSATKTRSLGPRINPSHLNCDDINDDDQTKFLSVTMDNLLETEVVLDLKSKAESVIEADVNVENLPEVFSKYLSSLNDQQREAACCDISTPLMVVAGPGSGKTSTMVGRVLMLLYKGIAPANILAMTFTTAAASEMRDRIGAIAGKEAAKELTISTFHSFCLQLCRSHAGKLGRTSEFLIYGHAQQRRAIIEAVRLLGTSVDHGEMFDASKLGHCAADLTSVQCFKDKSKKWQKFVAKAKASGKSPTICQTMGDEIGAKLLENYENILASCNALDYHDLISCSVKLLTDFPEVYDECQNLWKTIVIDEFQDTSTMQYNLLRVLASHNQITIVGDEDQSIFSFNGADLSGFDSFRKDFPNHREIRLSRNYRSTRCIVEAASALIHNNVRRCQLKKIFTDNASGYKITVKECHNEDAQCAFVVDKILEAVSDISDVKCSYSNIAILYRRQISGKAFQTAFRDRKIPFNIHGVAFYRKKVTKSIMALLKTTLPGCDDGPFRQAFKALLSCGKEEKKKVVDHIDKISTVKKCSFISAANDIFTAKLSGTFKRSQLTQGRKVLCTLDMISKLVHREQSISSVITSVANMLPQKYLLEQRAVLDVDGGKFLNEEMDLRSVLQYLLDDVANFLSTHLKISESERNSAGDVKGCSNMIKAFVDYISSREIENFQSRRKDNEDSVTLTTIHQSKGLEWDIVFIVKTNETEIPLLHEFNGFGKQNDINREEERRLFYVAMTRARKKLYILYVIMDTNWQLLQPSSFLKEIPSHLLDFQADLPLIEFTNSHENLSKPSSEFANVVPGDDQHVQMDETRSNAPFISIKENVSDESMTLDTSNGNNFLKRFIVEDRSMVSQLFHQWARKKAFKDPKRLLDKIGFLIDERLRSKTSKHKDALRVLKSCLHDDEARQYAEYVLRWEKIPADRRAHIMREKQEHFTRLRMENAMASSAATSKQIAFLQSLGCTVIPTSRLHASSLIEQYKSL